MVENPGVSGKCGYYLYEKRARSKRNSKGKRHGNRRRIKGGWKGESLSHNLTLDPSVENTRFTGAETPSRREMDGAVFMSYPAESFYA